MEWYEIQLPQTDTENFTSELTIGSRVFKVEMRRITSPLFGGTRWRGWLYIDDVARQFSLWTRSWLEYYDYGFLAIRSIVSPKPSELQQAFRLFIGIEEDV